MRTKERISLGALTAGEQPPFLVLQRKIICPFRVGFGQRSWAAFPLCRLWALIYRRLPVSLHAVCHAPHVAGARGCRWSAVMTAAFAARPRGSGRTSVLAFSLHCVSGPHP